MGAERKIEAFDIVRVVRGDITGEGPLHAFPVAVRAVKSRRKRRQDIVQACLLHRRSARREMQPNREARIQAEWCRKSWLHLEAEHVIEVSAADFRRLLDVLERTANSLVQLAETEKRKLAQAEDNARRASKKTGRPRWKLASPRCTRSGVCDVLAAHGRDEETRTRARDAYECLTGVALP